ncbi:MAG: hypothetical protein ACI4TI_02605 [Christensenellales bacterium]
MIENGGEQPISDDVNLEAGSGDEKKEELNKDLLVGSSKFKSTEELLKAYENLEKEFTKKCQKLSALSGDNKTTDAEKKDEEVLPQYKREDWLKKTGEFLANNENAKNYVKQIAEILISDENLAKKEDALELAYSKVMKENFIPKEQLLVNEDFLNEFVYNNEKIKNKIIEDFLLNLKNEKDVPLISSAFGSGVVSSPKFRPKDLTEAGKFAMHILKK